VLSAIAAFGVAKPENVWFTVPPELFAVISEVPFKQMVAGDGVALTVGREVTFIVTVPLICWLQPVEVLVAKTLKVVALVKVPVGRFIVPPVPITGLPTFVLPELFLNW
jgi:hypothetical protein